MDLCAYPRGLTTTACFAHGDSGRDDGVLASPLSYYRTQVRIVWFDRLGYWKLMARGQITFLHFIAGWHEDWEARRLILSIAEPSKRLFPNPYMINICPHAHVCNRSCTCKVCFTKINLLSLYTANCMQRLAFLDSIRETIIRETAGLT